MTRSAILILMLAVAAPCTATNVTIDSALASGMMDPPGRFDPVDGAPKP